MKRPATWFSRQGANASLETGTIGLAMGNQRHFRPHQLLPLFGGFPYLLTRLIPAFYHLILLPRSLAPEELKHIARRQAQANQLPTCLVMNSRLGLYVSTSGDDDFMTSEPPRGGIIVTGRIRPCQSFPVSADLQKRTALLETFLKRQPARGFLVGDGTKGGRPPSPREVSCLAGRQPNGVPRGLICCQTCGEWKGECLDTHPFCGDLLVRVHCRCENNTRCAKCLKPFYERRVAANYYDVSDGKIWHVPGFVCLSHTCLD